MPLDPSYPADRLSFMLEDARPRVVLTQENLVSTLPPNAAAIVFLDASGPHPALGQGDPLAETNGLANGRLSPGPTHWLTSSIHRDLPGGPRVSRFITARW